MKTCKRCGETKALGAFPRESRVADGRAARCRACANAQASARHKLFLGKVVRADAER